MCCAKPDTVSGSLLQRRPEKVGDLGLDLGLKLIGLLVVAIDKRISFTRSLTSKQTRKMAPIEKKRRHKEVPYLSRKKHKSNDRTLETVSQENLPWNLVPFPDTFQDAEGFFGLEELSDVDVVRDLGKIQYKVVPKKLLFAH